MNIKECIRPNISYREKNNILYFLDTPDDIDVTSEDANIHREKWTYWRKANYLFFKDEIEPLPRETRIIDLGSGTWKDLHTITDRCDVIRVDLYPYKNVSVVCDLNKHLPFRDGIADIVILSNTIEHIAEPHVLLSECYRILRRGGTLLGAVPYLINIHQRPYDFYRYTDVNLRYLLRKYHFQEISIRPVIEMFWFLNHFTIQFFEGTIRNTPRAYKIFFLRAVWKIVRMCFALIGKNQFAVHHARDADYPLGYLFRAQKK